MLLAAPLATALRQAYDTHIANARPIPASALARLKTYYSQEFLDQIRYSVGKVTNLTIPDTLGGGHKVFGHELGVTIQNLIIFTTEPGDDIWWWAHELQHVQQYAELESIEAFAWAYIKHYKSLERDADDAANKVVRALDARDKPSDDPSIPTIAVPVESDLVSVTFRNILSTGGWTMKVCAKPSREGTDPIDAQVLGIKFVERGGSTDCAVAWLSDAEAPVVSEIIEINTIDPSACEATFKSVFADISMIGWQCSNPPQVDASNPQ